MANIIGDVMIKLGAWFTTTTPLEARHFSSQLNTKFIGADESFSDHISNCRDMIRKVRSVSGSEDLSKIIVGNAPFELEPQGKNTAGKDKAWRRGVLLTHGLSDSPYFMHHLAAFFQEEGFRVMAVLLPGHGTQPGDLLDVTWNEWVKAVAYGTDKIAAEADEIYLAGYSAGGALSVYQSLQDKRVEGLFLFSPAFQISQLAAIAWTHKMVSWLFPRVKWVDIKPDNDLYKYESFAKNTAEQMYSLTEALNERLQHHKLHIPIFAVASVDDKTVTTQATIEFMAKQLNPNNKFILYTTDLELTSQKIPGEKIQWTSSIVPEQKIISSAHTAIVVAPEDKHYGIDGEYSNCIHYYPDEMEKYTFCSHNPKECLQGEVTDEHLKLGVLRRLMYNPKFDMLKVSLKHFIVSLTSNK